MAILKLGDIISDIRGSLGGITFSKNKSGNYAQLWNQPAKTKTVKRQNQRRFWSPEPQHWRIISNAQQIDWNTFAEDPSQELTNSMGESYYASGFNWFVKCNSRLAQIDRSTIDDSPVIARPSAPTISAASAVLSGGALVLTLTYPVNTFDTFDIIVWVGYKPTLGVTVWATKQTIILQSQSPGATSTEFGAEFEALYGLPNEDDKIYLFTHRQTTEGIRSTATESVPKVEV